MAKAPVDPEVAKLKDEQKKFKEEQKKEKKEAKARKKEAKKKAKELADEEARIMVPDVMSEQKIAIPARKIIQSVEMHIPSTGAPYIVITEHIIVG